ncbi:MAG: hypothetical protein WCS94_11245 [Verrucomicrobiota bacterium]
MEKLKFIKVLWSPRLVNPAEAGLSKARQALEYFLCILVVAGLGYADYLTGVEIVIFSFYLIPIRLASMRLGLGGGIVVSMSATLAWVMSDYFGGQLYSNQLVAAWNIMVRLMSFLVVAWLSARNAALLAEERATSNRLRQALSEIKLIEGLLPICATCKKIRDEKAQWHAIEKYIEMHSTATFTHGMCPDCARQWTKEAGIVCAPDAK